MAQPTGHGDLRSQGPMGIGRTGCLKTLAGFRCHTDFGDTEPICSGRRQATFEGERAHIPQDISLGSLEYLGLERKLHWPKGMPGIQVGSGVWVQVSEQQPPQAQYERLP